MRPTQRKEAHHGACSRFVCELLLHSVASGDSRKDSGANYKSLVNKDRGYDVCNAYALRSFHSSRIWPIHVLEDRSRHSQEKKTVFGSIRIILVFVHPLDSKWTVDHCLQRFLPISSFTWTRVCAF
jgi:hypothetical protein